MTEAKPKTENTNQFKKLKDFFKENITQIVLLINVVGFVSYFIYYKLFGISIFNYVGINDLIFFVLEYVFSIMLVLFLLELFFQGISYYDKFLGFLIAITFKIWDELITIINKGDVQKVKGMIDYKNSRYFLYIKIQIMGAVLFLIAYSPHKLITIPAYIIYALYLYASAKDKGLNSIFINVASLIIVIGLVSKTMIDTLEKSQEKQDYTISFVENNELITTENGESTLNYLGESSVAIFLYDIEREEARIYNKSNITDIRTQPSELYAWIIDCMLSVRNWISPEKDKQP